MSQVMLKSPRGEAIEPLVVSALEAKKDIPSCHKHVSNEENIIPAPIPDLEDVLKEVIMYLP